MISSSRSKWRARLLLGLVALLLLYTFKSFTVPILGSGSIAELTSISVNGDRQHLLIRGRNVENPILLFLHGGPGMPAMFLAHSFQRELERDFVVVHWDQRAAGKSFAVDIEPESIATSQFLDDLFVVVDWLRGRFDREKIYLLGHSHGSYLGILAAAKRPELFHAYIGVGQVVDESEAFSVQSAHLSALGDTIGVFDDTEITPGNVEGYIFAAGGGLRDSDSFLPLLLTGLMAPEYSLIDAFNVKRGSSFSSRHMRYDVIPGAVDESVRTLALPVFMISGRHDLTTPTAMSRAYLEELDAPQKKFFEIDEAAHFPFYEQPESFTVVMGEIRESVTGPD